MNENNIKNKVVVITGGSSGLGEATARHLASKGANVVIGARRLDRIQTIAEEINALNAGKATFFKMDVSVFEDFKALVNHAVATFGKIDVLVNNAGLMSIAPLNKLNVKEWNAMIDINIKGVLYGIATALPEFEKQKSGHFVNISSVAGIKVFSPGGAVYSGTKFAVKAISEGLRNEVGKHIRTTVIMPGLIDTELKHGSSDAQSSEAVNQLYESAIPASSVARAVFYALEQPSDVDINEIVVRPTSQEF